MQLYATLSSKVADGRPTADNGGEMEDGRRTSGGRTVDIDRTTTVD